MKSSVRRYRPSHADTLDRIAGRALRDAVCCPKKGAHALGVSDRLIRYWIDGDKPSPLSRSLELTASVADPFPIIVAHRIASEQALIQMTNAELAAEYRRMHDEETQRQGECDREQMRRAAPIEVAGMAARHAAALERLAALAIECDRRGIDPWSVQ